MPSLEIKGFVEASFSDWDGKVSTVVFFPGCNLRCPFCQNGDLILRPAELPTVAFASLSGYLERHRGWIDGVVLTGGEPTLLDGLADFVRSIRALGLEIKLDTNGTNPRVIEDLFGAGLVDYTAMDVKAPLDERYHRAAGVRVDIGEIRRSIEVVRSRGQDSYEFRTTLVPGLVGEDDVMEIARSLEGAARYVLQKFMPDKCLDTSLRRAIPFTDAAAHDLARRATAHVGSCFYRGKAGTILSLPQGPD
jgi:pyruvate formate lyase activating enzyme